jgi:hypothetical protein
MESRRPCIYQDLIKVMRATGAWDGPNVFVIHEEAVEFLEVVWGSLLQILYSRELFRQLRRQFL